MEENVREVIQSIHDAPGKIVLVAAGAGSQMLAWLLAVAGASRTLVEATIPYEWRAFDDYLGQPPEQYVSLETARMLAGRAASRAHWLVDEELLAGVACTATIATDRPKRGDHRAHLAVWTERQVRWCSVTLEKDVRERKGEEEVISLLILKMVAALLAPQLSIRLPLSAGDVIHEGANSFAGQAQQLLSGDIWQFHISADGTPGQSEPVPMALLSGSFNPLHQGHLALAQEAAEILDLPPAFEVVAVNADKPPLSVPLLTRRMVQFAGRWPVFASRAPTFAEKAALYPGSVFVVGVDTARRVLSLRFYQDSGAQRDAAMRRIRQYGCRFLVAGRLDEHGQFHDADSLKPPPAYADLFTSIPTSRFRYDLSSTWLRQAGLRGAR